jgi:hypothetical protein
MGYSNTSEIINSILSVMFCVYTIIFPLFIYIFLKKFAYKLEYTPFKARFHSFYLNVETSRGSTTLMASLFIGRRLAFGLLAIFLGDFPFIQLFIQVILCWFLIGFYVIVKPLNSKFLNMLEIFNEATLMICSYILYLFTSFVDDS